MARLLALALAPLLAAAAHGAGHTCIQDRLQARRRAANASEPRLTQDYSGGGSYGDDDDGGGGGGGDGARRALVTSPSFSPIRIKAIYIGAADTGGTNVPAATSTYLKDHIMQAAIDNWQAMLSVVPVTGNLFAARSCSGSYTSAPLTGLCGAYRDPAADFFCGSHTNGDLNIPLGDYVGEQTYFNGNGCTSTSSTSSCATNTLPAGTGVAGADFVIFVTAVQTTDCPPAPGESGTLAYASTCQRDQNDRPTWGRVNFCPFAISTAAADLPLQIAVATHELNHALGFNSGSWALWRNADGSPRTPRDSSGDPATTFKYKCGGKSRETDIVSSSTVAFSAERGMTQCAQSAGSDPLADFTLSNCVHRIVTPTVKAAARAHFDCPALAGAELENHLTTPCGSMGSHWEQRVLSTELMSSYVQHTSIVSAMTLALHEDSGWYKANYQAETGVTGVRNTWRMGDWGFKQGCAFAQNVCLDKTNAQAAPAPVASTPQHFYNSAHSSGGGNAVCSTDRQFYGLVKVDHDDQNFAPGTKRTADIPAQYRYFSSAFYASDADKNKLGGGLDAADYCPIADPYSNKICGNAANQDNTNANTISETFGPGSACFESTLQETDGNRVVSGAACMPFTCSVDGTSLTVTLKKYKASAGGAMQTSTVTCNGANKGTAVSGGAGFSGAITCPDPALLCATPVHVTPCPAGATLTSDGTCTNACSSGQGLNAAGVCATSCVSTSTFGTNGVAPCTGCKTCVGDHKTTSKACTPSSDAECGCTGGWVLAGDGTCKVPTASATASATASSSATMTASGSASGTATSSSTASATQTAVPQLPVASASPTSAAGTLSVYGALVFSAGAGGGGGGGGGGGASSVDVTAFASAEAVAALAASIKAALADSLSASPAAAKDAIGVTIISITDVATGNRIYTVANPGAGPLGGAPGSQGVKVDFVTQVPPTVAGGAAVASTLTAAVATSGSGAAGFQAAVVTHVAASGNAQLAGGFVGVTAAAAAPSVPSASPSPMAKATIAGVPLGAAIGGAVGAFVFAVIVGIAVRIVVRRMLGRGSKVAPGSAAAVAAAGAAPAAARHPAGSSV